MLLPAHDGDTDLDEQSDDGTQLFADLVIDIAQWSSLPGEEKVLSNTSSFTVPMLHDQVINVFDVFATTTPTRSSGSTKKKMRARKEATATDLRQNIKQFLQAKTDEYESWKKNEVFELVDIETA